MRVMMPQWEVELIRKIRPYTFYSFEENKMCLRADAPSDVKAAYQEYMESVNSTSED